jgi:hypothetical protein
VKSQVFRGSTLNAKLFFAASLGAVLISWREFPVFPVVFFLIMIVILVWWVRQSKTTVEINSEGLIKRVGGRIEVRARIAEIVGFESSIRHVDGPAYINVVTTQGRIDILDIQQREKLVRIILEFRPDLESQARELVII